MTGGSPPRPVNPHELSSSTPVPPGAGLDSATLRIRCSGEGFALARAFTRDTLRSWSLEHHSDDAVLVITELAANAVAHTVPLSPAGDAEVWLGLLLDPGHVVLTVSDQGENAPRFTADATDLREHGRGLLIVDALADEWGWTLRPPTGKTVWARLSTCPPP